MKSFKVPSCSPTTNKSVRFPDDLINKVEETIKGTDCTFTAFVVEAVKFSLENLDKKDKSDIKTHKK